MKSCLEKNDTEMHSEGRFVIPERFIRTLKNKINKCTTSVSKNVSLDELDDFINKPNSTYHSTMKPADVKWNTNIEYSKGINNKNAKFKVSDNVIISKYQNIFAKGYNPNWSNEVFAIKKVKNTVPWTYVISDLKGKEIVGTFYENELEKANQK